MGRVQMSTLVGCLVCLVLCQTSGQSAYGLPGEMEQYDGVIDDCRVDITDMMDYDPVTQTSARCERLKREREQARHRCDETLKTKLAETQASLDECRNENGPGRRTCPPSADCNCEEQATPCPDPVGVDDMFFRRLTRHLVNVLQEKAPETGPVDARIEVHLSDHEWGKLKSFVEGKQIYRKADIHDVLVGMTMDTFLFNHTSVMEWLGEQISLSSPGVILLTLSVVVVSMVFGVGMYSDIFWNQRFRACLATSIFLISFLWNWICLYTEETIKRYREVQVHDNIPPKCMPHKMNWIQTLQDWFHNVVSIKSDECFEYNRLYMVDPLFDVPPTKALSYTLSVMVVDPMKHLGRGVSEFHGEIFRDLPMWAAFPALISCYVFMFAALYAFIAAPRRVRREPLVPGVGPVYIRRPERPQAVGARCDQPLQVEGGYDEMDPPGFYDHQEGDRVQNVPPPTLPPVNPRRGENEVRQAVPDDPLQQNDPERPGVKEGMPGPSGNVAEDPPMKPVARQEGNGEAAERAVRPKTRRSMPPAGGNEMDDGSRNSMEPLQSSRPRPTNLGDSPHPPGMLKSVGSSLSGSPTGHPASEPSEVGSMVGSLASQSGLEPEASLSWMNDPSEQSSSGHNPTSDETTATVGATTPVSVDSPSDISVISPSPENITNSASYDFISDSSFGLGAVGPTPDVAAGENIGDEDSEDDFVVLKTER